MKWASTSSSPSDVFSESPAWGDGRHRFRGTGIVEFMIPDFEEGTCSRELGIFVGDHVTDPHFRETCRCEKVQSGTPSHQGEAFTRVHYAG